MYIVYQKKRTSIPNVQLSVTGFTGGNSGMNYKIFASNIGLEGFYLNILAYA
jgi:hypothetical protein